MSNPKVKCVVDTCVHWIEGDLCSAANIDVLGETARSDEGTSCKTFQHRGGAGNMIASLDNANYFGMLKQSVFGGKSLTPSTACIVETCRYWERGNRCNADSIEITGRDAQRYETTNCATFEERA